MMQLDNDTEEKRMRVYEYTKTDQAAANMLRIPRSTFTAWRTSRDLPPKTGRGGYHRRK